MRTWADPSVRAPAPAAAASVLNAVREDIRQTLGVAWIDPSLEAAAAFPVFFTAAWSAIRPNVGRSFLLLTRALRSIAAESLRAELEVPDTRRRLKAWLSDEEIRRVGETVRAAHQSSAKAQVVAHALRRMVERDRIPGTGEKESSLRRGVPEWQRWMTIQGPPDRSMPILRRAKARLDSPSPPVAMRLLARWPDALKVLWEGIDPLVGSFAWKTTVGRLRRTASAGVCALPHAVDLQWAALRERGFGEHERRLLSGAISAQDAATANQTLVSAFAWLAFGSPEIGGES